MILISSWQIVFHKISNTHFLMINICQFLKENYPTNTIFHYSKTESQNITKKTEITKNNKIMNQIQIKKMRKLPIEKRSRFGPQKENDNKKEKNISHKGHKVIASSFEEEPQGRR